MGVSTDPGPPGGPFVLTLSCPDRPRIVNEVTGFLVKHSGNIRESQQFGDPDTEHFFMRIMFDLADHSVDANTLRADFAAVAEAFDMTFQLWAAHAPHRTLILVSKHLHCLNDLLFRWGTGALQIEIPAIVSNHKDAARLAATYNVPFHHVPVTPEDKPAAETKLLELVDEHRIDLVVLARYMQVLSDPTCRALEGRAINIHHSFLPSFKGARPYQQAFEHGVKLVGATAHYVTGPRRGADHRAGHAAGRPRLLGEAAGDRRPRRGGAGALPGGALARGVAGADERQPHRRLPLAVGAHDALALRHEQHFGGHRLGLGPVCGPCRIHPRAPGAPR